MPEPTDVLVIGGHGVTGGAITDHLAADPAWSVTTASRRHEGRSPIPHVSVDLLDPHQAASALARLSTVTHLVSAAYIDRPTMAETTAPNVALLRHTLDALQSAGAPLQRVVLVGGGKSYGKHLGPYKTPAKERDPRLLGPIFYNEQEDLLGAYADRAGFDWTVLRPDVAIGMGIGSPMSLLNCIGVFATLSKDAGVPLRFPGSADAWSALHQFTDADLFARAVNWALTADAAAGEVFNVINGDQFRWEHIWPDIAEFFDLPVGPIQPMSLQVQMSDKGATWDRLVAEHDLLATPWDQVASWPFADGVWNMGYDLVHSTTKIRQAGFNDCVDSHESVRTHLARMRQLRVIP